MAYVTGLVMRRGRRPVPGRGQDRPARSPTCLADFARTRRPARTGWTAPTRLLAQAAGAQRPRHRPGRRPQTRPSNRCRDALTQHQPQLLERALGDTAAPGRRPRPARPLPDPDRAARRRADQHPRADRPARSPRVAGQAPRAAAPPLAAQPSPCRPRPPGEVIAELAAELDRVCARRAALGKEIGRRSWHTLSVNCSRPCPVSGRAPVPDPLAEIGDPARLRHRQHARRLRRPGPGHPPIRQSPRRRAAAAATTASRTPCSWPRSPPCSSPDPEAFYERKRAEGKKHNAALICLARRRCDVILAMLTRHPPYDSRRAENLAPPRLDNKTGTPPRPRGEQPGCL